MRRLQQMSSHGLTDQGFNRKRLDEILTDINSDTAAVFGENFDVDPDSPQGQQNGLLSGSFADLWEIAEAAYNAFRPTAAVKASLSELVQLNNITRQAATPSTVSLTLGGTDGTIIPSGSQAQTSDTNQVFATLTDVTITGGIAIVDAASVNLGPIGAVAGSINTITTPVTGWDTVTNPLDADLGTEEESDEDLRVRRKNSVSINAQNVIDAIFARVSNVPGVSSTTVLENDTSADPDANGLVAHSFEVIVQGGDNNEIAETIYITKPAGISTNGNVTVNVTDSQGFAKPIKLTRPTAINIFVQVDGTKGPNYPTDGDDQIKQAIVDYAAGQLVDDRGFGVGDDVITSELYVPANIVDDVSISALQIGLSAGAVGTANIPIDLRELSDWDTTRIAVNIT